MPIYHSLERYATHCSNTTSFFPHFIDIVSGEMTALYRDMTQVRFEPHAQHLFTFTEILKAIFGIWQ